MVRYLKLHQLHFSFEQNSTKTNKNFQTANCPDFCVKFKERCFELKCEFYGVLLSLLVKTRVAIKYCFVCSFGARVKKLTDVSSTPGGQR